MCKLINMKVGQQNIKIADIKSKYIDNIVSCAKECDFIDRVVLFGSCIRENCTAESDIDIAVFGNQPKGKCLTSTKFIRFADGLSSFDDFNQAYDILYFKSGKKENSLIMDEISKGEVLYVR